jgi:non-ribosomal peptide synthetase component F
MEKFEGERGNARFELSLVLEEEERQITGEMEYDAELFDPDTVTQMLEDFVAIAEQMSADPDQKF